MVNIYVLKLEQDKYYIGKTKNPTFRLQTHFDLDGSSWTKKYKPLKVIEIIPNCDDYDKNNPGSKAEMLKLETISDPTDELYFDIDIPFDNISPELLEDNYKPGQVFLIKQKGKAIIFCDSPNLTLVEKWFRDH